VAGYSASNRYEILEEVGRGEMAIVNRAKRILLDRDVAIKLSLPHGTSITKGTVGIYDSQSVVPSRDLIAESVSS
jgi:hypothetical protein